MCDQEICVWFFGYDVVLFKVFVFCLVVGLVGIGGVLFILQVGFMLFLFVGIVLFIEMVVFCVLGGCYFLFGGVYGVLLVNVVKSGFFEFFLEFWFYVMGVLFIGVVLVFFNGLVGFYECYIMLLEKCLLVIGKYLDKDSFEL